MILVFLPYPDWGRVSKQSSAHLSTLSTKKKLALGGRAHRLPPRHVNCLRTRVLTVSQALGSVSPPGIHLPAAFTGIRGAKGRGLEAKMLLQSSPQAQQEDPRRGGLVRICVGGALCRGRGMAKKTL